MFINYDPQTGVSINTFRKPNGYANSDVKGLLEDIIIAQPGCCPLEGAWDSLHDEELLGSIDANSDDVERAKKEIYDAIVEAS